MSARSLIEALRLSKHDVFYASTVAWLLDPNGTHGVGRAVLDQFAGFMRIHKPGLATALTAQALQVAGQLMRPGPLAQIRVVAGTTRIALIFTTHDALGPRDRPPSGYTPVAVSFDETHSNNLLTWPLGQVLLGLDGVECAPRWRHYIDGFRVRLRGELAQRGLTPKSLQELATLAAPAPAPTLPALEAPRAPPPTASLTGWGDDAGWGGGDSGWGADAPAPGPAASPASAWTSTGGSLADAWDMPSVEEAPAPEPEPAPAAPAPMATVLDVTQLNINPDVTFSGAQTLLNAAGATLLNAPTGPSAPSLLEASLSTQGGRDSPQGQSMLRVLMALQKAIGYFSLYPKDHPFCTQAIDTAHEGFVAHHEQFGAMGVRIQREGAFLDDSLLMADTGDLNSFAYLLYPEGIRSLTFERGLERREVNAFVEALSGEEESALSLGNDLLSNLWRRDFTHVQYLTYDQLSPQGLHNVHDPTLLPLAMRIQALVAATGAAGPDDELDGFLAKLAPYNPTSAEAMATLPEHADRYCESAAGRERQVLRASLLHSFLGDTLGRSADLVSWVNTHDEYGANSGDETNFMAGMVLNALWTGNMEGAVDLIARAAGTGSGSLLSDELLARLGSEQFLLLLARAMINHREQGVLQLYKQTMRYLTRLPADAFETVTRVACLQVDDTIREVFWKFIRGQATDHVDLMARLTLHADERVAGESMKILVGLPAGRKLLKGFVTDTEHPARAEIAKNLLGTATGEFSRVKDLRIVESFPIKDERMGAAKRLAESKQAKAFDRLAKLVQGKAFAKRDADEIGAVFDALIRVGGARSAAVLKTLSDRKGGLFGKADTQKVASEAARWLYELRKRGSK